jgi:hypothetical protein
VEFPAYRAQVVVKVLRRLPAFFRLLRAGDRAAIFRHLRAFCHRHPVAAWAATFRFRLVYCLPPRVVGPVAAFRCHRVAFPGFRFRLKGSLLRLPVLRLRRSPAPLAMCRVHFRRLPWLTALVWCPPRPRDFRAGLAQAPALAP